MPPSPTATAFPVFWFLILRAAHQPKPANMDAIVAANVRGVRPSPRIGAEELARLLGSIGAPLARVIGVNKG